ncbi:class I SAM-dependent methyltransferase [Bosea sp. (in: a-proteobacteria)]|uniref:class I SAM-dependent methyltransferase n=1 Tax=Bosea sp. (in: a-proteobacteria) TaxID=1871050 RepID=UPI002DDCB0B7|nr:methyltransferase domain-containing protein [Bosea sp. (in: a-proteobacteria)]HEV2508983.1 methyltransferase domain-containing protein [Bosea sp. (in: a-proteobacteria)]
MDTDRIYRLIDRKPSLPIADEQLEHAFWLMYPRFRFLKTLAADARLLDIGASTGGLSFWREWMPPVRKDIRMYGVDLAVGQHSKNYEAWDVVNLDDGRPNFPGVRFNGYLASHLIEHLSNLDNLFSYIAETAADGARIYFEWPNPKTMAFPKAADLKEKGFTLQTCNFFDDGTHQHTYEVDLVREKLSRYGFTMVEGGEIDLGIIAEELMARGHKLDNMIWRQMGFWSALGWSNYIIARKAPSPSSSASA